MPALKSRTARFDERQDHVRIADLLAPIEEIASGSDSLFAAHLDSTDLRGASGIIPRFLLTGPGDRGSFLRVGIFAGVHGDEASGVGAALELLRRLHRDPRTKPRSRIKISSEKLRSQHRQLSGQRGDHRGRLHRDPGAPPTQKPRPFEIVFETPNHAPGDLQVEAHIAAILTMLGSFRSMIAEAQNI